MIKDIMAVANVIASLLRNPMLVMDDKYPLVPDDFPERYHKIIFGAIDYLVHSGAKQIDEVVIDDYLMQYPSQHKEFEENRGVEYIQRALDTVSTIDNFEYYYDQLKKCSLLNKLEDMGFDIRYYHYPSAPKPEESQKSQENFNKATLDDILSHYDVQLSSLRTQFCSSSDLVEGHISKGMRELKSELAETPAFGLPMNSAKMNTICHGRRLRKFYLKTIPSGIGKALPNDTLIPTFDKGFQYVGDIQPGDRLIGRNGKPTTVLAVHPQAEKKQVYRIHFADGRFVDCCKDHLWTYKCGSDIMKTGTVIDLMRMPHDDVYIPLCDPVQYAPQKFKYPPYLIGYECGYEDKDIPEEYLFGSFEQRNELFQGLFDAAGHTNFQTKVFTIQTTHHNKILSLFYGLAIGIKAIGKNFIRFSLNGQEREYLRICCIEIIDQYKDMTCFTVDAEDALFLCKDYIVTHNTRISMADACRLAVPQYYDIEKKRWVKTKCAESVLFITTELEISEIQTLTWAYVACVPEDHITDNKYEPGEEARVEKAISLLENAKFYSVYIANFSIDDIENIIKRYKMQYDVSYVFFDYIFSSSKVLTEMSQKAKGFKLREDQSLMVFSERLKTMCNKYNVHIDSSTQANDDWKTQKNPDQSVIRGAKAIADKVDVGYIGLEPSEKDKEAIHKIMPEIGIGFMAEPNMVYHVYKVRRGKINHVKVFVRFDYGTLRTTDMFVTDRDYKVLDVKNTNIEVLLEQTDVTEEASKQADKEPKKLSWSW